MKIKLFDSELKVMEVLWREGDLTAGQLACILKEETGWNRNTTYTVIKRLIDKGAIKKETPGFICRPAVSKRTIQKTETKALINKYFSGSLNNFFTEYLKNQSLSTSELLELQRIISEQKR